MATYAELRNLMGDANYCNKIEAAIVDAATQVLLEADATANHANRVSLAHQVLAQRPRFAELFAQAVMLKNKSATTAQIQNATDADVLTEVAALWNEFADRYGPGGT